MGNGCMLPNPVRYLVYVVNKRRGAAAAAAADVGLFRVPV